MKTIHLPYGTKSLDLQVPTRTDVLRPACVPVPIEKPHQAVMSSLMRPIGSPSLKQLIETARPGTVAITISDITRPVPNRLFLPGIIDVLNAGGISDGQIVIIIARACIVQAPQEREVLVGPETRPGSHYRPSCG